MKLAFAIVTVAGIAIGLALPAAKRAPAVAATAPAAPAEATPVPTVIDRAPSGHFLTVANVNDEPIRFVVDTGADTVALTQADARRAHIAFDPAHFEVIGRGASGPVRGQAVRIAGIDLDGKRASDISGVVLAESDVSLLGQSYLRHMSTVSISGDTMRID
ncbi:TIGR02281 family clan AA aspartic protease [Sphingomonas sp. GC_Shp_3]|jgi:aspartyl protease family protein|uniref:retropepsin-like aspartic protease family protein n=1 Tax=Sphingomonas sp. GC_Shp_3 TaxID=2937383 RepID=UPI0022699298|nr:TIGR02281 family clan AA aspartic protease [Sphingomonas sp. GC_Shp_3]